MPYLLRHRRDVSVVEHLHTVELAVHVGGDQVVGDVARVGVGRTVGEARVAARQGEPAELDRGDAAAPRRVPGELLALRLELLAAAVAGADDLRVEGPGKA